MSTALAIIPTEDESLTIYKGWLEGVREGDKINVDGKVYIAEVVSSRKTTYKIHGVTGAYYVKTVADKLVQPVMEKVLWLIMSLMSKLDLRSEPSSQDPLVQFAQKVAQLRPPQLKLKKPLQPLQIAGRQALDLLVCSTSGRA
jgi:hypothetical protein